MINQVYRLVATRQFEIAYKGVDLQANHIVVRPTYLSICAADQRYYTGSRNQEVMRKKLPMALIHEGIGVIAYDPAKEYRTGTPVVMVPTQPTQSDAVIGENYLRTSRFCSSGYDGFMQDCVFLPRDRVVPLFDGLNPHVAAFSELISVSVHALGRFARRSHSRREVLGVWGDGNLGFITALLLKTYYPDSHVAVFGKTEWKLENFSFADAVYRIDEIPAQVQVDHAFECVGGVGSQAAVNQIIDLIHPEGSIALLGVSEYPIEMNTRMILEKGLTVIGSSRSGRADFVETVELLKRHSNLVDYLQRLVGVVREVRTLQDITETFEVDLTSPWGKTVMKWAI
ncbi:MAG: zinc-binding dehydrogenase [Alicyclobacillus herbarius]|uniref:ribitol-5-phosphate dehydrogenase n=1 Tax=Alicyclobacillus herbarius TaxID=122960 RepID=UPI0004249DA3|nr:ribitol-5-phosphate dehydrogenase [Alicyclobacillus herbarius]MCL6631800.1 zinc-binding dehydrogenase [Alicyclobacillus herbarius]